MYNISFYYFVFFCLCDDVDTRPSSILDVLPNTCHMPKAGGGAGASTAVTQVCHTSCFKFQPLFYEVNTIYNMIHKYFNISNILFSTLCMKNFENHFYLEASIGVQPTQKYAAFVIRR